MMAKRKSKKTIEAWVVVHNLMPNHPEFRFYATLKEAKSSASEGEQIYGGQVPLLGTLHRVIQ